METLLSYLEHDTIKSIVLRIRLPHCLAFWHKVTKDKFCGKNGFQLLESGFLFVAPFESLRGIILEFCYWDRDRSEAFDKWSVNIGKGNQNLTRTNGFWTVSTQNRLHLGQRYSLRLI